MGPTIYLINGIHYLYEKREYSFNILVEYSIITLRPSNQPSTEVRGVVLFRVIIIWLTSQSSSIIQPQF